MTRFVDLPYRPCVGLMVLNREGRAFVGRRTEGPEHIDATHIWQMPQGGLDPGEDTFACALRELYEETNIRSVEHLATIDDWLSYDIPEEIVGHAWNGKYRGQTQKWFALRFKGEDGEIDVERPGNGRFKPEFSQWRWAKLEELPELVVPFKRAIYERVVKEFAPLANGGSPSR